MLPEESCQGFGVAAIATRCEVPVALLGGSLAPRSQVAFHARAQCFRVLVDFFQRADGHPGLFFVVVEYSDVLLGAVEVQACDRLAVVVVQQYGEVGLGIPLRLRGLA